MMNFSSTDRGDGHQQSIEIRDGTQVGEEEDDVIDGTSTIISSLSSNTAPSSVHPPLLRHPSQDEDTVQSLLPVPRIPTGMTAAFGMKAVYARNEQAVEAGAVAAARDDPEAAAAATAFVMHQIEPAQQQQHPQVGRPPLAPVGKGLSRSNNQTQPQHPQQQQNTEDNDSMVTPNPPAMVSRQSSPGAISVPGIAAAVATDQEHDNLMDRIEHQPQSRLHMMLSSPSPAEQRPSYLTDPDSPPIVAELASSAFSYNTEDVENRLAERLEAQMNARLQQEVDRRLSQERQQHAVAEIVSPQKSSLTEQATETTGGSEDDAENFKICGIRRTCWGMILCVILLFIIGGVVGAILWFAQENQEPSSVPPLTLVSTIMPTGSSTTEPSQTPTMSQEDRRWDYLIAELGPSVVPEEENPDEYFEDPSTPHYVALNWMASIDMSTEVFQTPTVILMERFVITNLYFATAGLTNWTDSLNFLNSETSVCDWNNGVDKGVFCSNSGPLVTGVLIAENVLQGSIPWELSLLQYLVQLQFDFNELTGTIPTEFGRLNKLQFVWLKSNMLSGALPVELGNATSLESIDLENNTISSILPLEWGSSLSNLFYLGLRVNQIGGTLPVAWKDLIGLRVLDLEGNRLDGNLPTEYGALTQLSSLYLESNNFQGPLPREYGSLTNLRNFFVYGNGLTGSIPTQYSELSNLDYFWFQDTDLIGDVDDIFCVFPQVESLRADCLSDGNGLAPQINCTCCTTCCMRNGTNCIDVS